MKRNTILWSALILLIPTVAQAQEAGGIWRPQVEIPWNRYYRHAELNDMLVRLQTQWPGFCEIETIGESYEGRSMNVLILTDQSTGDADSKPAMWVDGNVHGNEVQGGEAAVYLAWWLLEHKDTNPRAEKLLRTRTFYILPSQNPDGRDDWFNTAGTAHSSRTGNTPLDNDRDGVADEDDTDDLDGDGEILSMRKRVPLGEGTHTIDPDDERIMVPARPGHPGDWVLLGLEGIDNDGDGRINEDGLGGYDMNRNWPSDWQPNHIQRGAGDYPFCYPETAAVGEFMLSKQNIAAVQSFHNSGGMILMGPGADYVKYPRADVAVYDTLGKEGEDILPFYRLMIVWKDLYTVHGGFVTWAYEGLGAFSFTNELWATPQYYGGDRDNEKGWFAQNRRDQLDFNDSVMLGEVWVDWHEVDHPLYGTVEVGGFKRQHGRVAPSFMIEEMIHRNAIFCARHAEEIAEPEFTRVEIEPLGDSLWRVTAVLQNERAMPTRSALAAQKGLGTPDRALVQGPSVRVLAGGVQTDAWRTESMQAVEREPHRLLLEAGVPAEGSLTLQWIVQGSGDLQLEYQADRAMNATWSGTLGDISE